MSLPLSRKPSSPTQVGETSFSSAAEVNTGTDATKAVTAAAIAGSNLLQTMAPGVKVIAFRANAGGSIAAQTGNAISFSSSPSTGRYIYSIAPGTFSTFVFFTGNVLDNGAQVTNHVQGIGSGTDHIELQTVFAGAFSSAVPFDVIIVGY